VSTTFLIALFLHIASLLAAFGAAGIMLVCTLKLRSAKTGAEAFPWGMVAGKTPRVFPIASLGLFVTGAYMTSKGPAGAWGWGSGWIIASSVGLLAINVEGAILGGRHGNEMRKALKENGPGPLSDRARELANSRIGWILTLGSPALVLGALWNMLSGAQGHPPSLGHAFLNVIVGWVAGAAIGLWIASRAPGRAPEAAASPAAS
jgi:hypothetical protein